MRKYSVLHLFFVVTILLFAGCNKKKYSIDTELFNQSIQALIDSKDSVQQKFLHQTYGEGNSLPYWYNTPTDFRQKFNIFRNYLNRTLLDHGIVPTLFKTDSIDKLVSSLDTLNLDYPKLAALDMMLTKSYYDYCVALKFGCVNPRKLYPDEYYIDTKRPDSSFVRVCLKQLDNAETLSSYLDSIQPNERKYTLFQRELRGRSKDKTTFWKIAANMERLRWMPVRNISNKHIWVNVASAQLNMMRGDSVTGTLRVGVGKAGEHETPLMIGDMYEIVLNPTWTVPTSIVVNEIVKKGAGIPSYIARNNMKVYKNGVVQNPCSIPWNTLSAKNQPYRIVQDSGESNSLGRIKFNFDNPFSVYLHDTDSRHIFNYDRRDVSHGCVRVQNPLKLAFFCLSDIDTTKKAEVTARNLYKDKMRIAIGVKSRSVGNEKETNKSTNQIRYIPLKQRVTVIIDYRTCVIEPGGKLAFMEDYYNMDDVLIKKLKNIPVKPQYKVKPKKEESLKEKIKQKSDSTQVDIVVAKKDSI